ncbi:hypothetical protein C2W64_01588 [Brevibacillus laterosporus]|uniref:DUF2653 family protein n=1 Tax=Brevibacillus laterosporus TaxID=1465 RepID=A0A518V8T5_BRELA|nr:YxcD family protein [Brevibacillus laterosporus]QDX93417.1 DUF2653 family protein [Brevibacillus laterosporus]RAP30394.1 hypothetical protein C2W64_01588 [Brevibacillus laterosporus]
METIRLLEQDLINAICLYIAEKREIEPAQVNVELMWDEEYGYSAEVNANGRDQVLIESNMLEALRKYLRDQMQLDPFSARIQLDIDDEEGMIALVSYNS